MYAAPLRSGTTAEVRGLLQGMNAEPGVYSPANGLLLLHLLTGVHFIRVLVVTDLAAADRPVYGLPDAGLPDYLVLLAEIDGEEETFRKQLIRIGEPGLRTLFTHCEKFSGNSGMSKWLEDTLVTAAANYVNWRGRTVVQVREEEALRRALGEYLREHGEELRPLGVEGTRQRLKSYVSQQQSVGSLPLTPEQPTPVAWQLRNLLNLICVPLMLLLLLPILIVCLPFLLWQIRRWERTDLAVAPPLSPEHAEALLVLENHEVTNQFCVFGSLKPGLVRLLLTRFLLWLTDYAARHLYHRGGLARVSTIHFARWVPMDGGQRMLFASLYDGSLESYMDDFINKVGFGLNLTFSNGIGYPRTRWLLLDGCGDEQTFKRVLRRHQLPTEVWWNAHPGLSAANKHRNSMIRTGLQISHMTETQAAGWLALL